MKNIKALNEWRDIVYSWIERFNIIKMSVLPNLIYSFNIIPIRISASCFMKDDKTILKFM